MQTITDIDIVIKKKVKKYKCSILAGYLFSLKFVGLVFVTSLTSSYAITE